MTVAAKILGGAMVIFSTSAYGFLMSRDLQKRLQELKEIKKIMFLLKGEIGFGMTPILEAAGNIAGRCGSVMSGKRCSGRDCMKRIYRSGRKKGCSLLETVSGLRIRRRR